MSAVLRPGLELVSAYAPPTLPALTLDLRDNVNLWGAPPSARGALARVGDAILRDYPSVGATALVDALAEAIGVQRDEVIAGCGSDDLIDAAFRAVASPGERVAFADPGFSMVPRFARLNALEPVPVPLRADGAADIDALIATGARILYLCSPNNPTGTVTPASEIRRCIAATRGIVIIDEAYAEFSGEPDWRAEVPGLERVLVLRTFSKAWGLAGLRVGYGVGSRTLVDAVVRSRGPYKVNAFAELAATAALRGDREWMRACAAEAATVRERLNALVRDRRGITPWASRGNFVFWQVGDGAQELATRFAARGVGVRAFSGLTGIGEALRIGVAPWEALAPLRDAIEEVWP